MQASLCTEVLYSRTAHVDLDRSYLLQGLAVICISILAALMGAALV